MTSTPEEIAYQIETGSFDSTVVWKGIDFLVDDILDAVKAQLDATFPDGFRHWKAEVINTATEYYANRYPLAGKET